MQRIANHLKYKENSFKYSFILFYFLQQSVKQFVLCLCSLLHKYHCLMNPINNNI